VHHYYVQTLWGFVQKRRRAIMHFLRVQEEMSVNWMKGKPPGPLWMAGVYCVTIIGRLGHTLRGIIRDGDPRWLWHVPATPRAYKRRGKDKPLIAELKVKQTLKRN